MLAHPPSISPSETMPIAAKSSIVPPPMYEEYHPTNSGVIHLTIRHNEMLPEEHSNDDLWSDDMVADC
jgi:hypothetical protein